MKITTSFSYRPTTSLLETKTRIKELTAQLKKAEPENVWPFPSGTPQSTYEIAYGSGIRIVHEIGENGGGVTIAYRKTSDFDSSNMVEVAVAYCSKYDTFSKKIGTANALKNWYDNKRIMVPARTHKDDYTIPHNLRNMFWYSINE